jgi:hypothetical protein
MPPGDREGKKLPKTKTLTLTHPPPWIEVDQEFGDQTNPSQNTT